MDVLDPSSIEKNRTLLTLQQKGKGGGEDGRYPFHNLFVCRMMKIYVLKTFLYLKKILVKLAKHTVFATHLNPPSSYIYL